MSFAMTFYKNVSPKNKLVKNLTEAVVYPNCQMLEGTSLLDTIFIMKKSETILKSNYCWALDRYYFINDIEAAPGGQLKVSCHCDVLNTYAEKIKECSALVSRQEKNFNTYQIDDQFSFEACKKVETINFPKGLSTGNQFVLVVNGKYGEMKNE